MRKDGKENKLIHITIIQDSYHIVSPNNISVFSVSIHEKYNNTRTRYLIG